MIIVFFLLRFKKLIVSSKAAIEIFEKFFEGLETPASNLDPQSLIASRIEFQVETVSLHLHGTVGAHEKSLVMK